MADRALRWITTAMTSLLLSALVIAMLADPMRGAW